MKHICGSLSVFETRLPIKMRDGLEVFSLLRQKNTANFLLESKSINPLYGRMSLVGIDPIIEICGQNDTVTLVSKNERGRIFFESFLKSGILEYADTIIKKESTRITLQIQKKNDFLEEREKTKRKNIAQVLRKFLHHFSCKNTEILLGLFGAFSYDFVRLFESLPEILEERKNVPDFHLFLFDTFVRFDLVKEKAEIICLRETDLESKKSAREVEKKLKKNPNSKTFFSSQKEECDTSPEEYAEMVQRAQKLAHDGEIFEVVFSRKFFGSFSGDPLALYAQYREVNPAPYLFFFDFGNSQLVGASPEMMVRVEKKKVHLRPISGTRPRGSDPISDHENELELLACEKERAELDMLIDLGRNDLKRVCCGPIALESYRHVEKYSRVMHTIAHLSGRVAEEYTALDALIACQSAGTLTGAPKVAAMIEIEKTEKERRGFYGGSIGYLTLGGEMDTGIIIRAAHIYNGSFEFRVGATLLYNSIPEDECKEVDNKARALLTLLRGERPHSLSSS